MSSTGDFTDEASTVNVLADSEPVNISSSANFPAITTVNIGSTGGAGTMAGIQGPISVVNAHLPHRTEFPRRERHDRPDLDARQRRSAPATGSVAVTGSATTTYNPADLSRLTVNGGSGGNTFNVNNTSGFYPTTLNTGTGDDTVNVFATGANTLDIHGQDGPTRSRSAAARRRRSGMQGLDRHDQRRQHPRLDRPGPRRLAKTPSARPRL